MNTNYTQVNHTLMPIYNSQSKIIILGTMPSPMSRQLNMYYAHPQNRFWKVLCHLFSEDIPDTNNKKIDFLLKHHIALWDVLATCNIKGASDQSIKDAIPNDLNIILKKANIKAIFTTGSKASQLYKKYFSTTIDILHIELPSTSPANCRYYDFEKLVENYKIILDYL